MRIASILFFLISAILSLLLGGFLLVSSRYEKFEAKVKAEDDLSSVAGDLVSEEELARMRQQEQARAAGNTAVTRAGSRPLILGVVACCAALLQIIGGVLVLVRRAGTTVLVLALLALGAIAAPLLLEPPTVLGVIAALCSAAALGSHALSLRRRAAS